MIITKQNPNGISTVRISGAVVQDFGDIEAAHSKIQLLECLREKKYNFRLGSDDKAIRLVGDNGVQNHIRRSDAYVFFGKPSVGELFKIVSLFVGLQTLDPDLHYQPEKYAGTHTKLRRPIIIYGDPQHYMPVFNFIMCMHKKLGTVRQDPYSLIRFADTQERFSKELSREIEAENSIHGHGATQEEIARKVIFYTDNTYFPHHFDKEPRFKTVLYTSASRESEDASKIAIALHNLGVGVVSGAGSSGSMGMVARGSHSVGGWSYGTNCPHIAAQEGIPEGMIVKMQPDIYTRMADMKNQANAIICGAGGFGGAGTLQELLAACLLLIERSHLMTNGRNGSAKSKPIILDNSQGMWEGIDKVLEPFGLVEGRNYNVAATCDKVIELVEKAKEGTLTSQRAGHGAGHRVAVHGAGQYLGR
jgi:predicted Rossmann-fold nucleotide-binding protein